MDNPLRTRTEYEQFLYTLAEQFPSVLSSTVIFIPRGATLGLVKGELRFEKGFRLVVNERIRYRRSPDIIYWYGYEVWRGSEKLYWYDSQPHPNDSTLASTHPHHKHIPPDIKHHRIPAPGLSFTHPKTCPHSFERLRSLSRISVHLSGNN
jgi:hypothetical protein